VRKKSYKPGAASAGRQSDGGRRAVFRAGRVPVLEDVTGDILVSTERANEPGAAAAPLARANEYEADATSVCLTSSRTTAEALTSPSWTCWDL
jgi:hypothetical protein